MNSHLLDEHEDAVDFNDGLFGVGFNFYGFLANRVRSTRLPIVYTLLKQSVWAPRQIRFPALLKASFGLDPLRCILCQATLVFSGITRGKALWEIDNLHDQLAQNRL